MNFTEFDITKKSMNPFTMIGKDWFLITAGNEEGYNTMTASWGSMGVLWNKNIVNIVVRPQRNTLKYLDNSDYFTISFFDEKYRDALKICGTKSGKDIDKAQVTGLTPEFIDGTTTFSQAKMVLICRKLYKQRLKEESFIDKNLLSNYAQGDYHYSFVGEIIKSMEVSE